MAGLCFAAITSFVGVHRCRLYSKLCTNEATNIATTAVHVRGTNVGPALSPLYSVYENIVAKMALRRRGKKASCEILVKIYRV